MNDSKVGERFEAATEKIDFRRRKSRADTPFSPTRLLPDRTVFITDGLGIGNVELFESKEFFPYA
jgi:hypothetical protein